MQIEMILSLSRHRKWLSRWPRQVQEWLLGVTVTGVIELTFANVMVVCAVYNATSCCQQLFEKKGKMPKGIYPNLMILSDCCRQFCFTNFGSVNDPLPAVQSLGSSSYPSEQSGAPSHKYWMEIQRPSVGQRKGSNASHFKAERIMKALALTTMVLDN